jgi:hypothetical protein
VVEEGSSLLKKQCTHKSMFHFLWNLTMSFHVGIYLVTETMTTRDACNKYFSLAMLSFHILKQHEGTLILT